MKPTRLVLGLLAVAAGMVVAAERPEKFLSGSRRLTLEQAVELALRQNPDLLKQKQEIERTRGVVIEVRAAALPHLVLTGGYSQQQKSLVQGGGGTSSLNNVVSDSSSTSQNTTGNGTGQNTSSSTSSNPADRTSNGSTATTQVSNFSAQDKSWNVTLQATQVLYSGAVGPALRIAKLTQDSSIYGLRDLIDTVVDNTRKQFYDVLLNRALIKVQEESVELLQNQLSDQLNRFEAGTVPRFNVLQAEVALANARPNLIRAKNAYSISMLVLAKTLGLPYNQAHPGTPFEAVGNLEVHERKVNVEEAIATAKARRPFLKIQRQNILIQAQNIKVALAGYQPTLQANGGYEIRNSRLSSDLSDTVRGWFFGVNGTWNVFDGLATYGKTKQARAQLESSRVTYEDAVHQVELEVQQAIDNLQQAKETRESQEKNVEQALEAVRLAKERLDAGAGTQLDVLNAQVQLTNARATELQARHDYNAAIADFERVTATATQYEELFDDPLVNKSRASQTEIRNQPRQ